MFSNKISNNIPQTLFTAKNPTSQKVDLLRQQNSAGNYMYMYHGQAAVAPGWMLNCTRQSCPHFEC